MKKIIGLLAIALCLAFSQKRTVTPTEIGAQYLPASCTDSTNTGLNVTVTTNLASKQYAFTGSVTGGSSYAMTVVDGNGGLIASGDPVSVTYANFNACNLSYQLQTINTPTVTINGSNVRIELTGCILPFNGTNGKCWVEFTQ